METRNLKATITLTVDGWEDRDLTEALANLKKDLETRFPPTYTDIVVTTTEK